MRYLVLILGLGVLLGSCHKQLGGPRKITAVGHIEYSAGTNLITQVYYDDKDDPRAFTLKLHRNYEISGDVSGTWAPSGAQVLLDIDGDFGPVSPLPIDYGYYESKPEIAIQGHVINMHDFVTDTYFIVVTKGAVGSTYYERHFVFE
ncbi:MAG: hypothetical protein HYZ14_16235 [Bacteroidetes bacterium]|nr:hypothetical protein [Bacteroidota bacterium]